MPRSPAGPSLPGYIFAGCDDARTKDAPAVECPAVVLDPTQACEHCSAGRATAYLDLAAASRILWNRCDHGCVSPSNAAVGVRSLGLRRKSMKYFVLVALGICLAVAPLAHADEWSKTYTITGRPELRVETSDANIHVDTWDQKTIEARVTSEHYKIGERGLKIEERQSGDSVELRIHFPHDVHIINFNFHGYQVDVEIHMPREGKVNLHTGDGHQDIDSVDGMLRARAGDGHITAAGRFDGLDLTTGDGRIEARALAGSTVTSS